MSELGHYTNPEIHDFKRETFISISSFEQQKNPQNSKKKKKLAKSTKETPLIKSYYSLKRHH